MPVNALAGPPKTIFPGNGRNTYRTDHTKKGITTRKNLCLRKAPVSLFNGSNNVPESKINNGTHGLVNVIYLLHIILNPPVPFPT